jgi:hypothetical protein
MHRTGALAASFYEWVTAAAIVAATALGGCSPAGQATMAEVGNLAGTVPGFATIGSSGKVNDANAELARANARLAENQSLDLERNRDRVDKERPVVAKILFETAGREHDQVLADLARWVEAGGDPDYAFKYMLTHTDNKATDHDESHARKPPIVSGQLSAPPLPLIIPPSKP